MLARYLGAIIAIPAINQEITLFERLISVIYAVLYKVKLRSCCEVQFYHITLLTDVNFIDSD